VRPGEDLERLADLYYGDPGQAAAIAAANELTRPADLVPGSVLHLFFGPEEFARARRRAAALGPYNRGVVALDAGDLAEAERQFRLALRTAPDLADARYNLALALLERGQTDAAADTLARLVAARPDDPDFGFALGNARFHQTRYREAAAAFAEVLARWPEHRRAAFGHARALQEAGERAAARQAWRRYLELDADSSWAARARRHLRELDGG
jgi:tetratricopeptide (TPR) repeat protein